jgi:uncharacterized protein (DUF362 family)
MKKFPVAVVRYEEPLTSVRRAIERCRGLDHLPANAKVFIKPNVVFWTRATVFPKWGVITTSRVVEDVVVLLKDRGIDDITIGEGTVTADPKDRQTPAHAFESLGYKTLEKRYGVRLVNVFERPLKRVYLGDDMVLQFNADALASDFIVNLPVMKTHNQTVVSLGIKNLKGLIDISSRKKCHTMAPGKDLHVWVSRLAEPMPPMLTLLDGIYTNERGPGPDGRIRRSNILAASADVLSVDLVGTKLLGHEPQQVPHLVHAAKRCSRPLDLSDIDLAGEGIEDLAADHEFDFVYHESDEGIMPIPLAKQGLKGIFYHKYDLSMCTYCSGINGVMLSAIRSAWKGKPWQKVEVLTGKSMKPTPGMNKTILLGKCIYQAHKDNPDIQEMIAVKGCPPKPKDMLDALHKAGIEADPKLFEDMDKLPGFYMSRYEGKPEYDEALFRVS